MSIFPNENGCTGASSSSGKNAKRTLRIFNALRVLGLRVQNRGTGFPLQRGVNRREQGAVTGDIVIEGPDHDASQPLIDDILRLCRDGGNAVVPDGVPRLI